MAQSSFGNLLRGSGFKPVSMQSKPLDMAMFNKTNPSPLQPSANFSLPNILGAKTANAQTTEKQTSGGNAFTGNSIDKTKPAAKPVEQPAAISGEHLSGLIGIAQGLQKSAADLAKKEKESTGGIDPDKLGGGVQGQLIQNALTKGKEAAEFTRTMQKGESDVMHDPNYSKSVAIGRAGLIQEQSGQQAASLTEQARQASELAGRVAPVSQFGVLTDPLTGKPISENPGAAAFEGGKVAGQAAAGQQFTGMTAANTAAKGIENTITSYLAQNPDLNPSNLVAGNIIDQWLQGKQLADPKYQTLLNYLNEYVSTLAPILGVGGDTTNLKTEIAQSFVNAQASGQSISQVLGSISKLADDKLKNFQSGAQGGGTVAGGTGGAPIQAGGFGFVQDASGKWVPSK